MNAKLILKLPFSLIGILSVLTLLLVSCRSNELQQLEEENAKLKALLAELESQKGPRVEVPPFTVGVAASSENQRNSEHTELLRQSLEAASTIDQRNFQINSVNDEQELAKLRGVLIRQHLSEGKVPVLLTDLSFKLRENNRTFTISEEEVPSEGLIAERIDENWIRLNHPGPIQAHIELDGRGEFSLPYSQEGVRGTLPLELTEAELFSISEEPRFARQGDFSLNWKIDLAPIQAYQVSGFNGDIGMFLHRMRYPNSPSRLNQYQTVRDSTFLFGYGPYPTGLIQRMETPPYIERVEVLSITEEVYNSLEPGMSEGKLLELLAQVETKWEDCQFAELKGQVKSWERPVQTKVPFLSRQTSPEKGLVFYTKYDKDGPLLVGDYSLTGK